MRKNHIFASLFMSCLLLSLVTGCAQTPKPMQEEQSVFSSLPSGMGRIRGKVTDTNEPANNIAGALVTYERFTVGSEPRSVKADSEGNYATPALMPDTYVVTVSKKGYKEVVKRIEAIEDVTYNPQLREVGQWWGATHEARLLAGALVAGILTVLILGRI